MYTFKLIVLHVFLLIYLLFGTCVDVKAEGKKLYFNDWILYYDATNFSFTTEFDAGFIQIEGRLNDIILNKNLMFYLYPKNQFANIPKKHEKFIFVFGDKKVNFDLNYEKNLKCFYANLGKSFIFEALYAKSSFVQIYHLKFPNNKHWISFNGFSSGYEQLQKIANNNGIDSQNEGVLKNTETNVEANSPTWNAFSSKKLLSILGIIGILLILFLAEMLSRKIENKSNKKQFVIACPKCSSALIYNSNEDDFIKCKNCGLFFNARNEVYMQNNLHNIIHQKNKNFLKDEELNLQTEINDVKRNLTNIKQENIKSIQNIERKSNKKNGSIEDIQEEEKRNSFRKQTLNNIDKHFPFQSFQRTINTQSISIDTELKFIVTPELENQLCNIAENSLKQEDVSNVATIVFTDAINHCRQSGQNINEVFDIFYVGAVCGFLNSVFKQFDTAHMFGIMNFSMMLKEIIYAHYEKVVDGTKAYSSVVCTHDFNHISETIKYLYETYKSDHGIK